MREGSAGRIDFRTAIYVIAGRLTSAIQADKIATITPTMMLFQLRRAQIREREEEGRRDQQETERDVRPAQPNHLIVKHLNSKTARRRTG